MLEFIIIPTLVVCAFLGFANFVFSKEKNIGKRSGRALEVFGQQIVLNIGCLVITVLLVIVVLTCLQWAMPLGCFERGGRSPVARFRERGKRMKIYAIEYFNVLCIAYLILIIWARNVAWFFGII